MRHMAAAVEHRDGETERLQTIIKQLQRMQFGRRSERLDPDQLALGLEDLDGDIGRVGRSPALRAADVRAAACAAAAYRGSPF
jgi:transposase